MWLFEPSAGLTFGDRDVYELVQCAIDGHPRPIAHHSTGTAETFTVTPDRPPAGRDVHVAYAYRLWLPGPGRATLGPIVAQP